MARPKNTPKLTEEQFEDASVRYFKYCIENDKMPNIAGLCVFIDISRDTFYEYAKRYSDTIKRTYNKIEAEWVQRLNDMGATGAIFYLKNAFRELYKDRHDVTSDGKPLQVFIPSAVADTFNIDATNPETRTSDKE